MKLISTTQTSAVAGGSLITTTAMAVASSLSVAAGSTIAGFGGGIILTMGIPIGITAGMVAYHEGRSHGGNLGAGGIVGAIFSGTSTLVGNALSFKSASNKPSKPDVYCLTHDCNIA